MKKNMLLLSTLLVFFLISTSNSQTMIRVGSIPVPAYEEDGWGNAISGVDFDGDGRQEIYVVNNNYADVPNGLIPKIFKYEFNGTTWDSVWGATLDIPKQNSWPPLAYGDLDKDGKMEIIWAPVNFLDATVNANPNRIIVFEEKGDGSDIMGVPSGNNYLPNADYQLQTADMFELRPVKITIKDIDRDNTDEIIFADRQANWRYGVVSVNTIPDNGNGSEIWNVESNGLAQGINASTIYDMAVVDSTIYIIHSNGSVTPVRYANGTYTVGTNQVNVVPTGSWKSAQVADINKDGQQEIVAGGWGTTNTGLYLLQKSGDTLLTSTIYTFPAASRIYGGATGDIDKDGKVDFVFGSRGGTPNAIIWRLEYQSGDIKLPGSYTVNIIDSSVVATGGRFDIVNIGNVDQDTLNEVVYGNGGENGRTPLTILDVTGQLPVELAAFSAVRENNNVKLSWSTATETNNLGFEVQRKTANNEFVSAGFVKGNGTTTTKQYYSFVDKELSAENYTYRLKQIDHNGNYSYSDEINVDMIAPNQFTLNQNYPNPFNPTTTISFSIPVKSNIILKVYNIAGEEVANLINNEIMEAGLHNIRFDASKLVSGVYIYKLTADAQTLVNKMMLMK
ncbi:MAG TPA: FG-GAP-like repeat-containing protein [Ignavibacteriaceae bacterium]|nr:FG-GAP-like repeat-containing protein [Ignavibacteriaceae bacterium]